MARAVAAAWALAAIATARYPGEFRGYRGMSEEARVDAYTKNGYS